MNAKKVKTLILQEGTKTVSKLQKNSNEILDDIFNLIDACKNKFLIKKNFIFLRLDLAFLYFSARFIFYNV